MRIRRVEANNRKRAFEVFTVSKQYTFPYAKLVIQPTRDNPIATVYVDPELGREAFTYELASGDEGSVHIEQVMDYNRDPQYLRKQLAYQLTLAALEALEGSGISKREICRRLRTSPTQLYRLLDPSNDRKSVDQMLNLLTVLEKDVSLRFDSQEIVLAVS